MIYGHSRCLKVLKLHEPFENVQTIAHAGKLQNAFTVHTISYTYTVRVATTTSPQH